MKHLGDITKINGYEVPIVDIITGGSPCQDLSVAGKRAGLAGERSGLFMEQIRIIKEMREKERQSGKATNDIRPRYMVWENVPGAFSSNQGEDFRAVLEETVKVVEEGIFIPECPKGKWLPSGCILGDSWSVAWRVHDAQFWGVPQRRKRISLVADFNGHTAPEILFEREGLSRDSSESKSKEQGTSTDVKGSVGKAISFQERGGKPGGGKGILIQDEHIGAMKTNQNQYVCSGFPLGFRAENTKLYEEKGTTLCNGTRPGFTCGVVSTSHGGFMINADDSNIAHTLQATDYKDAQCVAYAMQAIGEYKDCGVSSSLKQRDYKDGTDLVVQETCVYALDRAMYNQGQNAAFTPTIQKELSQTLVSKGPGAVCESIVRRLTPLECERLQGFPDNWTDIGDWTDSKGKKHKGESDAPRYKALGNSIALPFWQWLAERMVKEIDHTPTMASLFDGISGFCLVYARAGCKPIWSSEIENFPIAVAKKHFGDDEKGEKGDYEKYL